MSMSMTMTMTQHIAHSTHILPQLFGLKIAWHFGWAYSLFGIKKIPNSVDEVLFSMIKTLKLNYIKFCAKIYSK